MKPIYVPKGKAREYGDYAINIYTGCPHRCWYCYSPAVLRKGRELFHTYVEPRPNIVEETKKQIQRERITGKLVHLCFTCDPYPRGYDCSATREIIKALKASGNCVQILTKGNGVADFDLLDSNDWYGITYDGGGTIRAEELNGLLVADSLGIRTWVSFEPVLNAPKVLDCMKRLAPYADKYMIGKLNYHKSSIDWKSFGEHAEALCRELGVDYYIKESLRKEIEKEVKA